jgi:putative ABC transport system permease protein
MNRILEDVRNAVRSLRARPRFAAIVVFVLALAIGPTVAIFSVVNAVLLKSLPYREADRLVVIWDNFMKLGMERVGAKPADFIDYRNQNRVFEDVGAFRNQDFNLTGGSEPEHITGARITPNLFPLLGATVLKGRVFSPREGQSGESDVVILSQGLWQRRFGGDDAIVGRQVMLDGRPYLLVGVMPPDFQFPHWSFPFARPADLWIPLRFTSEEITQRQGSYSLRVLGRLKPGVTIQQARADMDRVGKGLEEFSRGPNGADSGWRVTVFPLSEEVAGKSRKALLILAVAVGLVLLIACANVASLLLARSTTRQKEISIRTALGATRVQLVRQLLAESLLLSLIGGAAGLLLGLWGLDILLKMGPEIVLRAGEVGFDNRVLSFALVVSILTGLVFGLAPAIYGSNPNLEQALRGSSRQQQATGRRSRSLLVTAEVALSLILLVAAGLMIKSFIRLQQVQPGLDRRGVLTAEIPLSTSRYAEGPQMAAFAEQLVQTIESSPGVESAAVSTILPLQGAAADDPFSVEGRPLDMKRMTVAGHQAVSGDYFRALRIPMLQGRAISERDGPEAPAVAVINQSLARTFFAGEDPLGKRMKLGAPRSSSPWLTIVGVAADVAHGTIESSSKPDWYFSYRQSPSGNIYLLARTDRDPRQLAALIQSGVRAIDKEQPVASIRTMDDVVDSTMAPRRFNTMVLTIFAAIALVLAAAGIYGVVANSVAQRTREIGVRMALGATGGSVLRLVVRQGIVPALAGIVLGIGGALLLTRFISSLLFEIGHADTLTFVMVSLVLAAVALVACLGPALRAVRVDPTVALRQE